MQCLVFAALMRPPDTSMLQTIPKVTDQLPAESIYSSNLSIALSRTDVRTGGVSDTMSDVTHGETSNFETNTDVAREKNSSEEPRDRKSVV